MNIVQVKVYLTYKSENHFYLLCAIVHQLHRPPQPLDVFLCHLHHLLYLCTLLWPDGHTLYTDPFCQALGIKMYSFNSVV